MKLKEFLELIEKETEMLTEGEKDNLEVEVQLEYAFDGYTECLGVEFKRRQKVFVPTSWREDGTFFVPYLALCILRN